MHTKTTLEYSYTPSDFFPPDTVVTSEFGELALTNGVAVLTLPVPVRPVARDLIGTATDSVKAAFQTRQILTRKAFKLTGPNVSHYNEHGGRDIVLIAETAKFKITGFAPDILITGPNGVVRDTRAERTTRESKLLKILSDKAATSAGVRRMLQSFSRSIDDPANELVHLYEIRDAAVDYFGNEKRARAKLAISKADWSLLGRLANDEPLHEGRHRGRHAEILRDASEDELDEARRVAELILEAFARAV